MSTLSGGGKANELTFQNEKFHQLNATQDVEVLCSFVAFNSCLRVKNEN